MPSRLLSPTLLIGAPKKTTDKLQRVYVTLRHESSRIRASATGDSLMSGEGSYTGWTLSTGFGSVQSLRSGVDMSAQHGSWIPVHSLPARLRRSWSPTPAIS